MAPKADAKAAGVSRRRTTSNAAAATRVPTATSSAWLCLWPSSCAHTTPHHLTMGQPLVIYLPVAPPLVAQQHHKFAAGTAQQQDMLVSPKQPRLLYLTKGKERER